MTTAVDTNIFEGLWSGTSVVSTAAQRSLDHVNTLGPIVIAAPVYAELAAAPGRDAAAIDAFLNATRIRVDWMLDEMVWRTASFAYKDYAQRRREQRGDPGPRRILADFMIGAHAVHHATVLLTFDRRIYRTAFPSLTVIVPDV